MHTSVHTPVPVLPLQRAAEESRFFVRALLQPPSVHTSVHIPASALPLQRAAEESRLFVRALLQPHSGGDGDEEGGLSREGGTGALPPSGAPAQAPPPQGSSSDPNNDNHTGGVEPDSCREAQQRALRGVAAQLQALGYEAGVWDLMGAVQVARRALDALTSIIAAV